MKEFKHPKVEPQLWEKIVGTTADGKVHRIGMYSKDQIKGIFDKQKEHIDVGSRKPKILVVDDEPNIVTLLRVNLRDHYEVMDAYCGEEAIKKAKEEKPDLITMDVMMPAMDGLTVSQELKNNPLTKDIPIVIISAKTQTEDKFKAIEAGADDYITKPFTKSELKEVIDNNLYFE
jgi:CheY-like chemotaxis protein